MQGRAPCTAAAPDARASFCGARGESPASAPGPAGPDELQPPGRDPPPGLRWRRRRARKAELRPHKEPAGPGLGLAIGGGRRGRR